MGDGASEPEPGKCCVRGRSAKMSPKVDERLGWLLLRISRPSPRCVALRCGRLAGLKQLTKCRLTLSKIQHNSKTPNDREPDTVRWDFMMYACACACAFD